MKTLRRDAHINATVEEVHNFGQNPDQWEQWYANFKGPKSCTGHGEAGTVVEGKYSLLGIRLPVTIEVLESTNRRWKVKITGPMEGEQIVNLVEEGDGSHLEMITHYQMPNKVLNKLANNKMTERMMLRAMVKTIENWKNICETMH